MEMLSLREKICILICLALVLVYGTADREPILQNRNLTWEEARNHCQVCFKDLITLGPTNIQTVAQNLTYDYWLGLRKNSSSNSTRPWTRWVNGDPLTFQNWYPGWPVSRPSAPNHQCCSCSCTCPGTTTAGTTPTRGLSPNETGWTMDWTNSSVFEENASNLTYGSVTTARPMWTTAEPLLATCERSPMPPPKEPETDQRFIEDSCVAMLSIGAWVERNCTDQLPFICYEDPFLGPVYANNVTSNGASLSWLSGPPGIHHYRIEVRSHGDTIDAGNSSSESTSCEVGNLTEGTHYTVRVFPVKCERDLNPQTAVFFTPPNKVEYLETFNVTNTSVLLKWRKPKGNVHYYRVVLNDTIISNDTRTTEKEVGNLTPGSKYRFTVISGIRDFSKWSEACTITNYTKPGIVTELSVSDNTKNSLLLKWKPPKGNLTGYKVKALNAEQGDVFNTTDLDPDRDQVRVTGLQMGTRIRLSVTAVANDSLLGDEVVAFNYTAPEKISNLSLNGSYGVILASWDPPEGNYSSFTAELRLDNVITMTREDIKKPKEKFESLKTAANYTVTIYAISGHIRSNPVSNYVFTLPQKPTDAKAFGKGGNWTVEWKAPPNVATVTYRLQLTAPFWGLTWVYQTNETKKSFDHLTSGTRYEFKVQTIAGQILSNPEDTWFRTDPDKSEITLSMMCSSQEVLLCDRTDTRKDVFDQLEAHFTRLLTNDIYWELEQLQEGA